MKRKEKYTFIAFIYSFISHGIAFLQFILKFESFHLPEKWLSQASILMCLSLLISFFLVFFYKKNVIIFFLILSRFAILLIIGYPLGDYIGVEVMLLTALIFEIGVYTGAALSIFLSLAVVSVALFSQNKGNAWENEVLKVSLENLLHMGSYPLIIMFLIRILKCYQKVADNRRDFLEQLKNGSSRLVETNIQLQEYVLLKEDQAIFAERKRLSREIHDIIGHTLMSIILMMKAATRLSDEKKGQLHDFLLQTKDQAQKGLNETRKALRVLRSTGTPQLTLVTAMNRLVKAFQETHIKIRIHYGNIPWSFNKQIDLIIYRAVQEGITNSLRHGNAQKIDIFFWYDNGIILVTINDDGVGCEVLSFGIGLNGIRERLDEFNGHFEAKNIHKGFQLKLCIPWMQGD